MGKSKGGRYKKTNNDTNKPDELAKKIVKRFDYAIQCMADKHRELRSFEEMKVDYLKLVSLDIQSLLPTAQAIDVKEIERMAGELRDYTESCIHHNKQPNKDDVGNLVNSYFLTRHIKPTMDIEGLAEIIFTRSQDTSELIKISKDEQLEPMPKYWIIEQISRFAVQCKCGSLIKELEIHNKEFELLAEANADLGNKNDQLQESLKEAIALLDIFFGNCVFKKEGMVAGYDSEISRDNYNRLLEFKERTLKKKGD